jgi:hypothetical protein
MKHECCFLIVSFILLAWNVDAQRTGSFVGIQAGASTPTGAFSKTDVGSFGNWNNTSGFAKTGMLLGVDAAWMITRSFGVAGSVYYADHGELSQSDATALANSFTEAFGVDQSAVSTQGRYRSLNFLLGPCYALHLSEKFSLDFRVMGGLLKSLSTPQVAITLTDDDTDYSFSQNASTHAAFGWQAGTGIRYKLSAKFSLLVRVDYFQSPGVIIDNSNRVNNAGREVTRQPMSWLNSTAGVVFAFGKK